MLVVMPSRTNRTPIHKVAIVALPGVAPFELGVAWEGFGIDRADDGVPGYDCSVVSIEPTVQTAAGYSITTQYRLDHADDADLVIIPARTRHDDNEKEVLDLLRRTVQ